MIKIFHWTLLLGLAALNWQCSDGKTAKESEAVPSAVQVAGQSTVQIPSFETFIAKPKNLARPVLITGRVQAVEKLQLVAEVQGKVLPSSNLLIEGKRFKKGENLVNIDDAQYKLNLQAQKSQFEAGLVRIMSQIQMDFAEEHAIWDKYLRAFHADEALPDLPKVGNDQLRFFLSANNIFASFYTIKAAEEMLPKYQVNAPFTGIITQGSVVPGAIVSPGVPLVQYSRTDIFELRAMVSTSDIKQLSLGSSLELEHNNTRQKWTGRIHRLGGTIDPTMQSVPVFIRLSGKGLREGMFLQARKESEILEGVVDVPLKALNRENQIHYIDQSLVKLKKVTPVLFEKDRVWIKGLEGGEEVIIEELLEPIVGIKAISKS